jgi:hypothetical protein
MRLLHRISPFVARLGPALTTKACPVFEGESTTWPRSHGLNAHERARFRSSWSDPEEPTLARRRNLVFDRRHAALPA